MHKLNVYQILAIILTVVGMAFSYLVAELDDAPGMIIIGSAVTVGATSILYAFGETLKKSTQNNKLLADILEELKTKKK